ncbi:MAG: ArsR family transcriptional regulator [Nitrospirae bacterium]|nr:MAG: ArsR family transcriptional regulator [Nitrospirota bacterium]
MRSTAKKIETLRIIAHPIRIKILDELTKGVKCVSDLEEFLEISQPNVSQHLSLLRSHGIIDYYVDGRLKCYFLVDAMIPELLSVLNKNYTSKLPAPACCPITKKGKYPGVRHGKQKTTVA